MKKLNIPALLAAAVFLLALPAAVQAELYQYKDQEGVVHFTDDYGRIPEKYRSQVKTHESTEPEPEKAEQETGRRSSNPEQAGEQEKEEAAGKESLEGSLTEGGETASLQQKREALVQKKEKLNSAYKSLAEEKKQLEARREELSGDEEIEEYNTRVNELNRKIKQYRKEEEALKAEINKYNQQIREKQKNRENE